LFRGREGIIVARGENIIQSRKSSSPAKKREENLLKAEKAGAPSGMLGQESLVEIRGEA